MVASIKDQSSGTDKNSNEEQELERGQGFVHKREIRHFCPQSHKKEQNLYLVLLQ